MSRPKIRRETPLTKKARRGFRGYPMVTIVFYGPDNIRASKVAVGLLQDETSPPAMSRWFSEDTDVRHDPLIARKILDLVKTHGVKSVLMQPGVSGCPHEEAIDYPDGEKCPQCPYWATHDRFPGEVIG